MSHVQQVDAEILRGIPLQDRTLEFDVRFEIISGIRLECSKTLGSTQNSHKIIFGSAEAHRGRGHTARLQNVDSAGHPG